LDSIYAQGFTDYEIVLVDDGSTDELNEAIRPYLQRGLTFLRNERNMGVGVARNRGVRASHGSWIIFFDSDNRLLPDALAASHARAMEADSKVGVIWGRSRLHGVPNAPKDKIRLERMNYHDLLVLNSDIPEAVPIVRRTLIERFPFHENLGTRRECGSLVWHAIARAGFDYVWTREMVQEYFLQPDSLSAKDYLSRHPEEMVVCLEGRLYPHAAEGIFLLHFGEPLPPGAPVRDSCNTVPAVECSKLGAASAVPCGTARRQMALSEPQLG
jgi:glycosyltransferase involved in cell wall biosynthesis